MKEIRIARVYDVGNKHLFDVIWENESMLYVCYENEDRFPLCEKIYSIDEALEVVDIDFYGVDYVVTYVIGDKEET